MKKNPDFPVHRVVFIVVSFLLAVLDMTLLYTKLYAITSMPRMMAMITALILATVANFTALTWGWSNGRNLEEKMINKRSCGYFLGWVFIGLAYVAIRVAYIVLNCHNEDFTVVGEAVEMCILAISYIGTGFLIAESAAEIWDADCVAFRVLRKKFLFMHENIASEIANLQSDLGVLSRYESNYLTLERQKKKIEGAIRRAEKGVMSDIVGGMCSEHTEISPVMANRVMEQVIEANKREEKTEAL